MTIQLIIDNVEIPVKHIRFSDGSSNVKLEIPDGFKPSKYICLSVDPTTPVDNYLWELNLVHDAIQHEFNNECELIFEPVKCIINFPYLPHGRADRRFEKGNAWPLNTFLSNMIWGFENVEIILTDPHSNHYETFSNYFTFKIIPQSQCFVQTVLDIQSGDVLVSPDKGAVPKIEDLHRRLHNRDIATFLVKADKKRDVSTGRIIETVLPENANVEGKRCIMVDDILDAGGTFIPLAQKLKDAGASSVELYVTHGIFAKGLNLFKGVIDKLHVYGTVGTYVTQQDIMNFNDGKEVK